MKVYIFQWLTVSFTTAFHVWLCRNPMARYFQSRSKASLHPGLRCGWLSLWLCLAMKKDFCVSSLPYDVWGTSREQKKGQKNHTKKKDYVGTFFFRCHGLKFILSVACFHCVLLLFQLFEHDIQLLHKNGLLPPFSMLEWEGQCLCQPIGTDHKTCKSTRIDSFFQSSLDFASVFSLCPGSVCVDGESFPIGRVFFVVAVVGRASLGRLDGRLFPFDATFSFSKDSLSAEKPLGIQSV